MKAVDTNVVLRLLLNDDLHQSPLAFTIFTSPVLIPTTVLLEVHWVLRSVYDRTRADIADALNKLVSLPTAVVDGEQATVWAISKYRDGADLEDALHVVAARGADSFLSFDGDAVRRLRNGPIPAELVA